MKVHILFGQRKQRYKCQFAPEALEVADEYAEEDNPGWLYGKQDEYLKSNEFEALQIVTLEVPDDEIEKRLYPMAEPIIVKTI